MHEGVGVMLGSLFAIATILERYFWSSGIGPFDAHDMIGHPMILGEGLAQRMTFPYCILE